MSDYVLHSLAFLASIVILLAVLQVRESRAAQRRQRWREAREAERAEREAQSIEETRRLREGVEAAAALLRPESLRAFFGEAARANTEATSAHQRLDGHEVRLNDLTGRVGRLEEDSRG